jgi:DNA polymerase-3 subunit chi
MDRSAVGEWWFYQLADGDSAADALGPILEKCVDRGWRVLIVADEMSLDRLDVALWSWKADSFLPHGREGADAARHPILLSGAAVNLNGARIVILLDGRDPPEGPFERTITLIDTASDTSLQRAREQYRRAQTAGTVLRFFVKSGSGWVERTGS